MSRLATRARSVVPAVALALLGAGLAGCSSDVGSSGDQGFVSGKGLINSVDKADRQKPGPVAGTTLDGKHVALSDFRGKTVVINVWGSWCGPCRAEAPMLAQAARDLEPKGVVFLGINNRDNSKTAAQAFQRNEKLPYPTIYDQGGTTLLSFHGTLPLNAIPATVVVDPQGLVSGSVNGPITRTTIDDLVDDAVSGGGA